MTLLVVEAFEAEILDWLSSRHSLVHAPELAHDPRAFRRALAEIRAMIVPPTVLIDAHAIQHAPLLRAIGRISAGAENIDVSACMRARIELVRSATASAQAEAEFTLGAALAMLRRVPVPGPDGTVVGRELGSATVGLIGMPPAARVISRMLIGFGSRVVGYDPSLHATDSVWNRWRVEPLGLRELLEQADAVCVMLSYFSRYKGLLGNRFLPFCKPHQVLVSIGHSALFDEAVLADVLRSGRVAAAWLDSLEPGALDAGRPLHGIASLQITPRVASTTRESRRRSAWAVARRIDDVLAYHAEAQRGFRPTVPGAPVDLSSASWFP